MDPSAYRTSALLVLALVVVLVLAFGGLVSAAVGDALDGGILDSSTTTQVEP